MLRFLGNDCRRQLALRRRRREFPLIALLHFAGHVGFVAACLEFLDSLAQTLRQFRQLLRAEHQQHHGQNQNDFAATEIKQT